jgi:hypothetical protein
VSLDYIAIVGGGAHLLFSRLQTRLASFFGWNAAMAGERIVGSDALHIEARYANAVGLMLLARDQLAIDEGRDVDTSLAVGAITTDKK